MDDSPVDLRPSKRAKLGSPREEQSADNNTSSLGTNPNPSASLGATKMVIDPSKDEASKEVEVGITAFVDDAREKFQGILKKRYTDFLVNEILPDGRVVHLQNMNFKDKPTAVSNDDGVSSAETAGQGHEEPQAPVPRIEAASETQTQIRDGNSETAPESTGSDEAAEVGRPTLLVFHCSHETRYQAPTETSW